MRPKTRFPFWRLLVVMPLLASTAPNCVGVDKRDGAFLEGTTTSGTDFLTTCAAANSYISHAEPIFQSMCVTCHAPGGTGNSEFALIAGTSLSNADLNTNYSNARKQLLSDYGGTNLDNNPILANPLGNNGHTTVFTSAADPNAAAIYQWIFDEQASPCAN